MVRPNKPEMLPKHTRKVQLGIYHTQVRPSEHDIVAVSGLGLDVTGEGKMRYLPYPNAAK